MTKKVRTYSAEFKAEAEAVKNISDNKAIFQRLQSSLALPCKRSQIGITKPIKASLLAQSNMILIL